MFPITTFLKEVGLAQYAGMLLRSGFDDMETLIEIEDDHLRDLGLPPGHALKLRKRLKEYRATVAPDPSSCDSPTSSATGAGATAGRRARAPRSVDGDRPARAEAWGAAAQEAARGEDLAAQPRRPPKSPETRPAAEEERFQREGAASWAGQSARAIVRASWEQVHASGREVLGELILRNLFRIDREAVRFFDFGEGEVFSSPRFQELSGQLVNALHLCFTGRQGGPGLLRKVFAGPLSREGARKLYRSLTQAVASTIRTGLREGYTADVDAAWHGIVDAFASEAAGEAPEATTAEGPCYVGQEIEGGRERYRIEQHLQRAIFGDVWQVLGLASGQKFALKVVEADLVDQLRNATTAQVCEVPLCEVQFDHIVRGLDHVVQMEEHFGDLHCHFIVSELATGGDLLEALKQRPGGLYERQAQALIRQAAKGLSSLHRRGLAMQDVSLENMLLFVVGDGRWQVRLCDPGQAVVVSFDSATGAETPTPFHGFVGKQFRPPELYSRSPYLATKVDAWCLGWSTFFLLVARPMFHCADPEESDADWALFDRKAFTKLFAQKGWRQTLSPQAKDFILRLMHVDPEARMSVRQALQHPWLLEEQASGAAAVQGAASAACTGAPRAEACEASRAHGADGEVLGQSAGAGQAARSLHDVSTTCDSARSGRASALGSGATASSDDSSWRDRPEAGLRSEGSFHRVVDAGAERRHRRHQHRRQATEAAAEDAQASAPSESGAEGAPGGHCPSPASSASSRWPPPSMPARGQKGALETAVAQSGGPTLLARRLVNSLSPMKPPSFKVHMPTIPHFPLGSLGYSAGQRRTHR